MISQTDTTLTVTTPNSTSATTTTANSKSPLTANIKSEPDEVVRQEVAFETNNGDDNDIDLKIIPSDSTIDKFKDAKPFIKLANNNNNNSNHNNKVKKRKFEETIIDGFAIIAFKSWEDLQEEVNERKSLAASMQTSLSQQDDDSNSKCSTANDNISSNSNRHKKSSKSSKHHRKSTHNNHYGPSMASDRGQSPCDHAASKKKKKIKDKKEMLSPSKVSKSKNESDGSGGVSSSRDDKKRNKTSSSTSSSPTSTASVQVNLKKALEATEKKLSIVQEENYLLKQEQIKNRQNIETGSVANRSNNEHNNDNDNSSIIKKSTVPDHYATISNHQHNQFMSASNVNKDGTDYHPRTNGILGQDLLRHPSTDPNSAMPNQAPYSTFHINSHLHSPHRSQTQPNNPTSVIHQPLSTHQQPRATSSPKVHQVFNHQNQSSSKYPAQSAPHMQHNYLHQQHTQSTTTSQPGNLQPHNQQRTSPPPHPAYNMPNYRPQAPSSQLPLHPQPLSSHHSQQPAPIPPSPLHHHLHPGYSPSTANSLMTSSMRLGALPPPYGNCPPPSLYINETISRQTSITPMTSLGPTALEQLAVAASAPQHHSLPASRYNHSSIAHLQHQHHSSIAPYNNPATAAAAAAAAAAVQPYYHPALYHHHNHHPTLATERSFIEFARSYSGPGHLGYPSLMNTLPPAPLPASISNMSTTTSSISTANPYSLDRWPPQMATLDHHQRATAAAAVASRYNSLYQSTTTLPDRSAYANYAATRPPPYPAGLFVSIINN